MLLRSLVLKELKITELYRKYSKFSPLHLGCFLSFLYFWTLQPNLNMTDLRKRQYIGALVAMVLVIVVAFFVFGDKHDMCPPRLVHIDSLMEKNPKAAYDSLLHIDSTHIYDGDKSMEMRMLMLKAKAQNKLDMKMPSDSVFKQVVSYYDRHGSANDRMFSRYLLGCIYRDMNDAPEAIEWYTDAAEQADTMSNDCDYKTLFRIYGQMAYIYNSQYLPDVAMKAHLQYSKYALRAGDVYNYIRGKEFVGAEYLALGDTVKALRFFKNSIRLYNKHGLDKEAASAYPTLINVCISREQYDSARVYMDIYEKESGLFKDGKIVSDRQHYYYYKGLYSLSIGKIDEAECYFRLLLVAGFKFDAYKGLLAVYHSKMNVDSIKKYSVLSEKALDEILENSQIEAMTKSSALYNYNRIKKEANAVKFREQRNFYIFILIGVFTILICLYAVWYVWNMRKKRMFEKKLMLRKFISLKNELLSAKTDMENIRTDKDAIIQSKESEVEELQNRIAEMEKSYHLHSGEQNEFLQMYDETVLCFKKYTMPKGLKSKPTDDEWEALRNIVKVYSPKLYSTLLQGKNIKEQDINIALLTFFGFKTGDIALIFGMSPQSASNAKAAINKKLFGESSAPKLFDNLSNI